ncbi:MAG: energy transducer TonB [Gemmatimonadaceae bacterium]|nr:energy transducer TonB [Gemmatimonadaceae bacterium]
MIAAWMLAATALGLLASSAALATERVFRLLNRQGRHVWVLALVVTCAWPLIAPMLTRPLVPSAPDRVTISAVHVSVASTGVAVPVAPSVRERLATFDRPLLVLWVALSVLLLARAVVGLLALRRLARCAEPQTVVGRDVLITSGVGPAAFGIVRPRIVLPRWSLELDTPMRELVVRHEVEHVKSADPAVLTAAWLLVALFPWNASLWWIVRRLRTATELDCDHRVVRAGADRRQYAHLLLLISQRQGETAFASMIAGAPTTLPLRIAAMHSTPPARRVLRAALFALVALALGAVSASPVLARELASVRAWVPTVPEASPLPAPRTASPAPAVPMELPVVSVAPVRTAAPLALLAQDTTKKATEQLRLIVAPDTTKKPARRMEIRSLSSPPETKKGPTTLPNDAPVVLAPGSWTPRYPEILKSAGVGGVTVVQIVVDTTGLPIPETLKIVRSDHALLTLAVQGAIPGLRFLPARAGGRNVKQLAQMVYHFEVMGFPPRDTVVVPEGPMPTFKVVITGAPPTTSKLTLNRPSDTPAEPAPGSAAPKYPEILIRAGVSGVTIVQFVVDTSGQPIPETMKVVRSGHQLFTNAVKNSLPGLRFSPARVGGRNVRQLAQMVYRFDVPGYPPADTLFAPSGSVPTFKVNVVAPAPK